MNATILKQRTALFNSPQMFSPQKKNPSTNDKNKQIEKQHTRKKQTQSQFSRLCEHHHLKNSSCKYDLRLNSSEYSTKDAHLALIYFR